MVCAVRVPLTKKLSALDAVLANEALVAIDAVAAYEADAAFRTYDAVVALLAQLEVPNREPVIDPNTPNDPVI